MIISRLFQYIAIILLMAPGLYASAPTDTKAQVEKAAVAIASTAAAGATSAAATATSQVSVSPSTSEAAARRQKIGTLIVEYYDKRVADAKGQFDANDRFVKAGYGVSGLLAMMIAAHDHPATLFAVFEKETQKAKQRPVLLWASAKPLVLTHEQKKQLQRYSDAYVLESQSRVLIIDFSKYVVTNVVNGAKIIPREGNDLVNQSKFSNQAQQ